MALLEDLQALLEVQAVDSRILRAQHTIASLDTGAALAAEYNAAKAEAETLRNASNNAHVEQRDAELRLQTIETKAAQIQKTLYAGTVRAPKELENLQLEAEMLGRQRDDAELKVLESMETASERLKAAESAESEMNSIASRYRKVRALYKQQHASLTEEIEADQKVRIEAIRPVPAPLLARYDMIRNRRQGIGAAALDGNSCGACHTQLNVTLLEEARALKDVTVCEYCGRILIPVS